ncbi:MAG: hypothetical protein AB1603_00170 [Chloroflexota bacterium]
MSDDGSDATLVVIPDFVRLFPGEYFDLSTVIAETVRVHERRPLLIAFFGPTGEMLRRVEVTGGVATFSTPERAVRAMAKLWQYYGGRDGARVSRGRTAGAAGTV